MTSIEFRGQSLSSQIFSVANPPWPTVGQLPAPAREQMQDTPFRPPATGGSESASETIRESFRLLVPLETHDGGIEATVQQYRDTASAYKDRIRVLKEQAEFDGYLLSQPSKAAFLEFIERNPRIKRGRLLLMENGNLRAVWKGENGAHLGLQFRDRQSIQYVIFKQRKPSAPVSRVSGSDTMEGISRQIEAFDLGNVLYT